MPFPSSSSLQQPLSSRSGSVVCWSLLAWKTAESHFPLAELTLQQFSFRWLWAWPCLGLFPAGEKRIKFKQVRMRFSAFMALVCLGGSLHSDCSGWIKAGNWWSRIEMVKNQQGVPAKDNMLWSQKGREITLRAFLLMWKCLYVKRPHLEADCWGASNFKFCFLGCVLSLLTNKSLHFNDSNFQAKTWASNPICAEKWKQCSIFLGQLHHDLNSELTIWPILSPKNF